MRVSNAADAPAGPCSLPPPGSPGTRPRNAGPPLGPRRLRTPPGKLRRDQGRAEDRGPAAAVTPRHPAAREDPAADAVRDRGRAAEILEIDVQDLDLDNRQAAIRSQRRRDPMGVLGHRHRPPAPALAAPARRHFSYERTAVPVRTQSVPARRPAPRHICPHTGRARLGYDRCRVLLDHYAGLELHQLRHSAATTSATPKSRSSSSWQRPGTRTSASPCATSNPAAKPSPGSPASSARPAAGAKSFPACTLYISAGQRLLRWIYG